LLRTIVPTALARRSLALAVLLMGAGGCKGPCDKLAQRVCEEVGGEEDEKCQEWRVTISKLNDDSCKAALENVEAVRGDKPGS
jgi:hypothetical protein